MVLPKWWTVSPLVLEGASLQDYKEVRPMSDFELLMIVFTVLGIVLSILLAYFKNIKK